MSTYLGIDLGTSGVKLLAIDGAGKTLYQCQREYRVAEPRPGWKEIDPCCWIDAIDNGLGELLANIDKDAVLGIGVTGQMHTVIPLDNVGKPLRPALMWNDTRTQAEVQVLKQMIRGRADTSFIEKIISTGSPAANLYWLKEHEPENFEKLSRFLIGPDYIVHYLTGEYSTDYCEASTSSLYDIKGGAWSKTMQEILGLNDGVYPPLMGSETIVGNLRTEIAERYGLSPEVYVIAGTGDNPAAGVATGAVDEDFPLLSLGTSGVLMVRRDTPSEDIKGKTILFSGDGVKMNYLVQGVVQSAGSSYHWLVKSILAAADYDGGLGKDFTPKHNDLLCYPHLVGDKTIHKDPSLRGAILGAGTDTTREDMIVAVMEGIAFGVRELTEVMAVPPGMPLKVTGGGAKNPLWMQILADVLNRRIEQLAGDEGAGYGVALLTLNADPGTMTAPLKREPKIKNTYLPRGEEVHYYADKYRKYKKIYRALKSVYE